MATTRRFRVRRSDRGVTLITFALSLVAIFAVIALVLGGSLGYSAERNSQTASDAAALAATSKLRAVQTDGIGSSEVLGTAQQVAEANGANAGDVTCELIANDLSSIADCGTPSAAAFESASGVRVDTADTRDVPFGEVTGQETITGATVAAATIQPLAEGFAPFMVCSPAPGHPEPVLTPSGEINSAAIGEYYVLQGTAMKQEGRDCGNPAANWRGWVNFDETYPLPGEWGIEDGNKNGHIDRQLAGDNACAGQSTDDGTFGGCVLALPLCESGNNGGGDFTVNCRTMGAFEIVHVGNGPSVCHSGNPKHICGEFIGAAIAIGGQGSDEQAGVNDVVVIKLVE